jgi:hypothetical protein
LGFGGDNQCAESAKEGLFLCTFTALIRRLVLNQREGRIDADCSFDVDIRGEGPKLA